MRHFLDFVLRALASHPEEIDILESSDDRSITYRVSLHPDDVGRVIGRNGRTISAIRSLLTASAARSGKRVMVEIPDAEKSASL